MTYSDEYSPTYAPEYWGEPAALGSHDVRALRRWLMISLVVAVTLVCRDCLWKLGLPISLRIVSAIFSALLVTCLLRCCVLAARAFPQLRASYSLFGRLNILIAWILLLAGYGLMRGNELRDVYKDTCGYLMCAFLIRLALYDEVWQILRKPLLIICLMGTVLVVATTNVPGVQTSLEGTEAIKDINVPRNLASLGYTIRSVVSPGLLFGVWGLVAARTDRWKVISLIAFLLYALVQGVVFEFRGVIVTIGGILVFFALLSPVLSGRVPLGTIVAVTVLVGMGLTAAVLTGKAGEVVQRFSNEQVFDARITEAQAFFDDMGPVELVVGRGMGATYNGPDWAPVPLIDGKRVWNANHFGILSFVLRGGFSLMLFVVVMSLPILWRQPPGWYANELNLAATVLAPFIILNVLINPISLVPDGVFDVLPMVFCLGRFAVPASEQPQ